MANTRLGDSKISATRRLTLCTIFSDFGDILQNGCVLISFSNLRDISANVSTGGWGFLLFF